MAARRRDPALDDAIFRGASTLLARVGYRGFTVEGVAELAGVPKSTVYRRWPSRTDLLAGLLTAVLGDAMPDGPEVPERVRAELVETVRQELLLSRSPEGRALMQMILAALDGQEPVSGEVADALKHRRLRYRELLEQAVLSGELPEGTDLELTVDLLLGAVWGQSLWHQPDAEDLARTIVDRVLAG